MSEPPPPPRPSGPPLKPPAGPRSTPPPAPSLYPPSVPPPPPYGEGPWQEAWDEESRARYRRRRVVLAVIGAVVIVGLLGGALATILTAGDDDPSDLTGQGEPALPGQPDPGGPGGGGSGSPPSEDELATVVEDISAFVEEERGLEFREPVDVELADDAEFEERLLADFEEDQEELEETGVLLAALGLVDPGEDVVEAMRSLLGAGVVGFYDPETAELVVRGANLGPYVRSTVAHELVHALDDQHFGLDRPEYDEADDETSFGFSAVVEGNARRIENAYMASLSEDERALADQEAMDLAFDSAVDLLSVPPAMIALITAPYDRGEPFVEALLADGGQEALDAAYEAPPRTSEQVLEPDGYLASEEAVDVPHPRPAGEVLDEGMAGQLLIEIVLGGPIGLGALGEGSEAAEGWGGDWAVAWRDGERSCATLTIVGDTEGDTDELRGAFDEWAAEQDGATVTGGSGEPVTVESCVG
jgi:hypothetical protein